MLPATPVNTPDRQGAGLDPELPRAELVALADRCVQCGLCLPACPTYASDRVEAESPRGRIALARGWALETIEATPTGEAHLDHCLGCRNCEAVCPAGVKYGELLVAARTRQRERRAPAWRQRWGEALAARPRRLRAVLALYRHLYRWLPARLRPLPVPPAHVAAALATAPATRTVAVFVGCVADTYEAPLRAAVARIAESLGIAVFAPPRQTCCGSLHAHAGNLDQAHQLASANRSAFAGVATVLTLASGCHDSVANALAGEAEVVDALSFFAAHASNLRFDARHERIALHLPCTQRNVVKSVPALRRLLSQVPGLQVIELDAGYGCCGAAGLNMLAEPERAAGYRQPLLDQLAASGATRLLSANIGCRLHLGNGTVLPVQHPLEFLADLLLPSPLPSPANSGRAF